MQIKNIIVLIENEVLFDSIQDLIKDLRAVQHGDRTNKFYDLTHDHHSEGGVWKHTKLALEALPSVAKALSVEFNDQEYVELYDRYVNELRAAVLYHDIGKLVTQKPSKSRPGSYSFQNHGELSVVQKAFNEYGIEPSELVLNLVSHHHDSPSDFMSLNQTWSKETLKLLIILKAADSIAVGSKEAHTAIEHVKPFAVAMKD